MAAFFVFSDYMRPSMRHKAALMGIRAIYVLTHDSIGVGEDGPTHQYRGTPGVLSRNAEYLYFPPLRRGRNCGMLACGD